jgi:hypothetical protein
MFSIIMTWVGALLGIVVLVAMASGTFIVDFDDAMGDREKKAADAADGSSHGPNAITGS